MSLAVHFPFDESPGSTVAYDYSPAQLHANVMGGDFVKGREGNCVYFPGAGKAEVKDVQPINFNGDFTVHGWFKAEIKGNLPTKSEVRFKFPNVNGWVVLDLKSNLHNWTHIAITRKGNDLCAYSNGKLADFGYQGPYGPISGLHIRTDSAYSGPGYCYIDNFIVLNDQVLTPPDLINIISNATLELNFYINGRNFKEFGVVVKPNPRGVMSRLETKTKASYDWTEYHGRVVDLSDLRFEPRKIELDCYFKATGKDATIDNVMDLKQELSKSGTIRLMIELGSKPFVYECYMQEEMEFDVLKWRDSQMFTEFTLKFIEPEPVKRVLLFTATNSNKTASITLKPGSLINVYWGDGAVTNDVYSLYNTTSGLETPNTITHTYAQNGPYYIVMSGAIEDIDQATFAHNAVLVWSRLF
jgi:hypothetical protein